MATFGMWHSGWTNLPLTETEEGYLVPDADLPELQRDQQRMINDEIRLGVLAEELGFDRDGFINHHFPAVGQEYSPNALMSQMAIAAQTDEIRLMQMANIVNWHEPVQLAEQIAMLDVFSGGRVEVGVGRGYQPKESEVMGQYWGGTVQDDEKNRASFEEKLDVIQQFWTEDLVDHDGAFHQVPPDYTLWHHDMEHAYFESDLVSEYDGEDLIDWNDDADPAEFDQPVIDGGSTLQSVYSAPKPLQDPHPQIWEPITSPRSTRFAAGRGYNGYLTSGTPSVMERIVEGYMSAAEEAGWPDHRPEYDGEPFEYGWDERRRRGVSLSRNVFITDHVDEETIERYKRGMEHRQAFFAPFGINLRSLDLDPEEYRADYTPDFQTLREKQMVFMGSSEAVADQIISFFDDLGYHDLTMDVAFNVAGLTDDDIADQMRAFAEDVIPLVEEEYPSPD